MLVSDKIALGLPGALPDAQKRPKGAALVIVVSVALVALIARADFLTGYDIRLAFLYLVPIAFATWQLGGVAGTLIALSAALCWLVTFESSHPYTHDFYFYWEGGLTGATYLVIVALLVHLRHALDRSDRRFVTVLEGLDAAVHVEDETSRALLYANRRYRESFGAASSFRPDTDTGEIWDVQAQRWYLVQPRPLRWTDGRKAVLRVLTDITEEKQARELIRKHRDTAHRTSRLVALGEIASAIAHELNQPLAAISTYNNASLRLMETADFDHAELRAAMQKCRDQARRAGSIIQRLREVLRHPVPVPTRVDLGEVAFTVLQIAEPEALEAGVSLQLHPAERLPRVRTDSLLIEQVALNLVRNAVEAVQRLPPERRQVRIATAEEADGRVSLTVSDLGEGVPAEVSARLFEAFVTTKPGGLGLGLSICRSVIESLGGSIRYEPGAAGARFSFSLPRADS